MDKLRLSIYDEAIDLDFVLVRNYYIPVIELPEGDGCPIGKWGGYTWRIWKKRTSFCSTIGIFS